MKKNTNMFRGSNFSSNSSLDSGLKHKPKGVSRFLLFLISVFFLIVFSIYINPNQSPSSTAVTLQLQTKLPPNDLSFAVLGDVHEDVEHLQVALRDLHTINPHMDALIFNGDTMDQGIEEQYTSVQRVLLRNLSLLPQTIIKNIGNHEFFDYTIEENTPQDVNRFIQRYLNFAGEKKVYHDTWLKNYHFISLGSEDGNSKTNNSIKAYISEEQQQWLKEKLAEDYIPGKPIFVFLHQPMNSSSNNGSRNGWVGTDQGDSLRAILSAYPEAILFTSHTHADLTAQSIVFNQPFTSVHTGAIHYTIVRHTQGQSGTREPYIKGLYVQVNGNNVAIKGRDFKEKTWIFSHEISEK